MPVQTRRSGHVKGVIQGADKYDCRRMFADHPTYHHLRCNHVVKSRGQEMCRPNCKSEGPAANPINFRGNRNWFRCDICQINEEGLCFRFRAAKKTTPTISALRYQYYEEADRVRAAVEATGAKFEADDGFVILPVHHTPFALRAVPRARSRSPTRNDETFSLESLSLYRQRNEVYNSDIEHKGPSTKDRFIDRNDDITKPESDTTDAIAEDDPLAVDEKFVLPEIGSHGELAPMLALPVRGKAHAMPPVPTTEDGEETDEDELPVQAVLDSRWNRRKGRFEYEVLWEDGDKTWEPVCNVVSDEAGNTEAVAVFHCQNPQKPKPQDNDYPKDYHGPKY
ncbi:hypothetical protein LTR66_006680 [Elasticomyces elasticus]|nr:hypothetical protein LTR66_006680 [Elasticomyces elasticus]